MKKIKIQGEESLWELTPEVKRAVVKINQSWFWRTDNNIIKVKGRYYRRKSPLLVKDYDDKYILKKDAVELSNGIYADKDDDNLIRTVTDEFSLKPFCINVDGKYYLKTDDKVVKCLISNEYILRDQAIYLSKELYKPNTYVSNKHRNAVVTTYDNHLVLRSDTFKIILPDGSIQRVFRSIAFYNEVPYAFSSPSNPVLGNYKYAKVLEEHKDSIKVNHVYKYADRAQTITLHKSFVKEFDRGVEFVNNIQKKESCAQVKEALNKFYSGLDDKENKASRFSLQYETHGGGVLFDPQPQAIISYNPKIKRALLDTVGGLGYTFGVEFETSAGVLTNNQCSTYGLAKHGDRSIGSFEYTTGILHGDGGIEKLKQQADALNQRCLVDDRCGLHVHVGGMNHPAVTTPDFNYRFGVYAVDLGCQLEPELYAISPASRRPDLKYCHSILRYKDVNLDNWKNYLGAYIFPRTTEDQLDDTILEGSYAFGSNVDYSTNTELNRWCSGRYKWLNIVNFMTRSRFKTLEFRIFAGTTDFDKVYAYVLIALAFTWFVENRAGHIVRKGNTLKGVIGEAYRKHPDIVKTLYSFIDNMKKKYNRKQIYNN